MIAYIVILYSTLHVWLRHKKDWDDPRYAHSALGHGCALIIVLTFLTAVWNIGDIIHNSLELLSR